MHKQFVFHCAQGRFACFPCVHDSVAGYLGLAGESVETLNGVEKKTMQRRGPGPQRNTMAEYCVSSLGNPNKVGESLP